MNRQSIYFSHDADAMNDPKCMLLIAQLGMEGYGTFWALVEMLRMQPDYRLPLGLLPAISTRLNTTVAKLETVIKNYNLFLFTEDSFFFSQSLNDRMEIMSEKIERRKLAGIKSGVARRRKALLSKNLVNEHYSNNDQTMIEQCSNNDRTILNKERYSNKNNINNNIYGESGDSPCDYYFENIWNLYERKGNKKTSSEKWKRLPESSKKLAVAYIPSYVASTPDKQYRKNFETFLNQETWNDELPVVTTIVKTNSNENTGIRYKQL